MLGNYKTMGSNEDYACKWFQKIPLSKLERARASKRARIVEILPLTSFYDMDLKGLEEAAAAKVEAILLAKSKTNMEYLCRKTLVYEVEMLLRKQVIKKTSRTQVADQGSIATKRKRGCATPGPSRKFSRTENSVSSLKAPPAVNRSSEADKAERRKEQIRQHIASLHSGVDCDNENDDNICQLCGMSELRLVPEQKYCACCDARIKRNVNYYYATMEDSEQLNFCSSCFNKTPREVISVFGKSISKKILCKEKNDDEYDEPWVCCNKCERWQHQICGLYNKESDPNETAEYSCPKCLLADMESGHYTPSSTSTAFFSAKDLKRTILSNHIEHSLALYLKQHKEEIAKANGESFQEVLRIKDIFVRVVLSEKKTLAVNEKLLNVIGDKDSIGKFPYTTKLILLFQNIKGIDVCLFGMYVQEYGSECSYPNQRCAYISYLDTVKYFEPEGLRTMIYHQVLIGYLDYIKQRGFTTCYLWSCPPEKSIEYIFYCHPGSQKTPSPERLRQWYLSMIKKANYKGIVVNPYSTFYDRFFTQIEGLNRKMTTASLPYFDGDYWPSTIDNYLNKIETNRKRLKDPSHAAGTDVLLMQRLEKVFFASKEDFMVIDLQFVCSLCNKPFSSGKYWHYRKSSICERCHALETSSASKKEDCSSYKVSADVLPDTKDEDEAIENGLFSNRNKFMTFCARNNYQFDTLRRAKHSSMMILHHLRHLTQPTEGKASCRICHKEEGVAGQCWSCKICPGFDICAVCYQREGRRNCHIHKLTPPPSRLHAICKLKGRPAKSSRRCGARTARNYMASFQTHLIS